MQMITLNMNNSTCETMDDQLIIATMFCVKHPNDVVQVLNDKYGATLCIVYSQEGFQISIGMKNKVRSHLEKRLISIFGQTKASYWKRSTLKNKKWFFFMIWEQSVCQSIDLLLTDETQCH